MHARMARRGNRSSCLTVRSAWRALTIAPVCRALESCVSCLLSSVEYCTILQPALSMFGSCKALRMIRILKTSPRPTHTPVNMRAAHILATALVVANARSKWRADRAMLPAPATLPGYPTNHTQKHNPKQYTHFHIRQNVAPLQLAVNRPDGIRRFHISRPHSARPS